MRILGVIPAAGHATRLQPLSASKEMLMVRGRPVIAHLVERMRVAPCDAMRVVTRSDKADLRTWCGSQDIDVVLGRPAHVGASVQLGLIGAEEYDVVLVGFPDTVWGPADAFGRMLDLLDDGIDVVLGLFGSDEPERGDVVAVDNEGRVSEVQPKPPHPRSRLIWGCLAARRSALGGIGDEPEPGMWINRRLAHMPTRAVYLSDDFVDIGTPDSLGRIRAAGW